MRKSAALERARGCPRRPHGPQTRPPGRGVALVDGAELELSAGDFLGFPAPSVPHLMANRSNADLVYLEGGERREVDVIEYPHLGKRFLLLHEGTRGISFYELGEAVHPFGWVEPPRPAR
jgi:hypothetical protein